MLLPGPDEVGDVLANTFEPLKDINVVQHAGRLLALAESDCPFRMSPDLDNSALVTSPSVNPCSRRHPARAAASAATG
jgi:hypothetical protein